MTNYTTTDHYNQFNVLAWQPIETAPRDGTEVIVCKRFEGLNPNDLRKPQHDMAVVMWDGSCWTIDSEFPFYFDDPTHWMPLPEPPK